MSRIGATISGIERFLLNHLANVDEAAIQNSVRLATGEKVNKPSDNPAAFFLISNFGVWLGGWYPMTGTGLLACYTNAIPFFGYTVTGDLVFTVLIFGAWELSRQSASQRSPILARG